MRQVTNKELSNYKILPFDLYNESNQRVLVAGEVLTPGKIIMLKNYLSLYTEEITNKFTVEEQNQTSSVQTKNLTNFSFDSLDAADFETVINKENALKVDIQVKLKYYFKKTLDLFERGLYGDGLVKLNSLVSILISDVFKQLYRSKKGSQVRFLGEYEICHPLNVAIVSGLIAKRLEFSGQAMESLLLSALLHDCGKLKIKLNGQSALLSLHEDEVANHTFLGYELIKNELHLPEQIAKVALEHHENNDGSGYPVGLSSDYISELAQIVNVANYYDNLAANRTSTQVNCNKDALRAMLEVGTKRFSARMLYTFIHMFNYDDSLEFNDMII
jgi:HD-GYP domain-containing protein (c-di-GMP phosphodiesterase class II)